MELRAITNLNELSELVSPLSFDEFYQKILEENRRYEEEYRKAFKIQRLRQMRGLQRILYENWVIFGKVMRLRHLALGITHPREYYQKMPFLWDHERIKYQRIPDENSDARPFFDIAKDIYNNLEEYKYTYKLLEDNVSKNVLMGLLLTRLTGDGRHLMDLATERPQYFDGDVIKAYANEVVADVGGYIGDSAQVLLKTPEAEGKIKRIYLYEPNRDNMEQAKINLRKSEAEVIFRRAGVSDRRGSLFITSKGSGSRLTADEQRANKVDIVTLDEDIEERLTFIKMDIEGSEKAALQGCQRHICEDIPKLAICVYHKLDDVWWLPQYIKSLNPKYKFYLRQYNPFDINETVMYCLPC